MWPTLDPTQKDKIGFHARACGAPHLGAARVDSCPSTLGPTRPSLRYQRSHDLASAQAPGPLLRVSRQQDPCQGGRAVRSSNAPWLPPYAPGLNPVEAVWSHVKYAELANLIPDDLRHLTVEVAVSLTQMRSQQELLRGFFRRADLRP